MVQISIICPIYNAELYIEKCINSVINQSFTDWELLLVDDGSTDLSSSICNKYSIIDKRIKTFHKKNGGVASARQFGLEMVEGKYVIHVDPDDWIEPNMLEELYCSIEKNKSDITICDFFVNKEDRQYHCVQHIKKFQSKEIIKQMMSGELHGSCCNKIIKTEFIRRNNIRFEIGLNYCEDLLFCIKLLLCKNVKVSYLPRSYYHYCQYDTSITNKYSKQTYEMRKEFENRIYFLLDDKKFKKEKAILSLNIFTEAFTHNIYDKKDSWLLMINNIKAALFFEKSIKKKIGYICILTCMFYMAHKLLKY